MITAASEGPHLRRLVGGTALRNKFALLRNCRDCREFSNLGRNFFGRTGDVGDGRQRFRLRRRTIPDYPRGLPCLRRRAFSSFRRSESGQAILTFQRTSQFFDFACDLCHATTFFRFPCRSDPRLR